MPLGPRSVAVGERLARAVDHFGEPGERGMELATLTSARRVGERVALHGARRRDGVESCIELPARHRVE